MGVISDECFTGSHISEDIAHRIDLHLVKSKFFHFFGDPVDMSFLIAAFPWEFYDIPQEFCHICFVVLCGFFDLIKIHSKYPPKCFEISGSY